MKSTKWHICITTYDYILKDRLTLHKWEWKYIIVDEGHRMKNARSKFAQVLG
jgi:ATP-dependent helicase STH1/SNF2